MTFRSRLAVLALVVSAPVLTGRVAQADPGAAMLNAEVEAQAAASSDRAVSESVAREDAALQRAIDRKIDARLAAEFSRPVPVRLGSVPQSSETVAARKANSRRALYAVK